MNELNMFDKFILVFVVFPFLFILIGGTIIKIYCWITGKNFDGDGKNHGEGDYGF